MANYGIVLHPKPHTPIRLLLLVLSVNSAKRSDLDFRRRCPRKLWRLGEISAVGLNAARYTLKDCSKRIEVPSLYDDVGMAWAWEKLKEPHCDPSRG